MTADVKDVCEELWGHWCPDRGPQHDDGCSCPILTRFRDAVIAEAHAERDAAWKLIWDALLEAVKDGASYEEIRAAITVGTAVQRKSPTEGAR